MKQIVQDIKTGNFKHAYLICGSEDYLRRLYTQKLKDAIAAPNDTMNCQSFSDTQIDERQVIDLAQTLPFMADRRLIIIRSSGFFKKSPDLLSDYMKSIAPDTYFIFNETEVDKRSRMYKAVKSAGYIAEMNTPSGRELEQWVAIIMKEAGKKLKKSTAQYIVTNCGTDMMTLKSELDKLIAFTGGSSVVTEDDVRQICSIHTDSSVFDMVESMAKGQQKMAMSQYYRLLEDREPPMRILILIARQFKLLFESKCLVAAGRSRQEVGAAIGLPPFIAGKYIELSRRFSSEFLLNALSECTNSEKLIKSGKIGDRLCVELLIVKYSA